MSEERYLFGDGEDAASRLSLLADIFESSSRAFLRDILKHRCRCAVDLGCGLGRTTLLLADVTAAEVVFGLDTSADFLSVASGDAPANVRYRLHDVTVVPFPTPRPDIVYCRFLLTHLRNPLRQLQVWASALEPGARLLVEEVEDIETGDDSLKEYLRALEVVLRRRGHELYVGRSVVGYGIQRARAVYDQVVTVPVKVDLAARMFALNLASWRGDAVELGLGTNESMEQLGRQLWRLSGARESQARATWFLRQVAWTVD